ncbi:sodium-coupled monocarboxylate transporter 1-like [Polistes fuscatus]|uniref:sodium-coupled monocarboxylate transporter 1-like n=1 Tax=Polistes fuscatus TaxID=30207 RepID=UPI001CA9F140|nr:sodium-coupled monocarboxylate transporter 1-like [Polistes fuscatus]
MTSEDISDELLTKWVQEIPTVQEINKSMQSFAIPDYTVFVLMLSASAFVGIYFGFIKKISGEDEYLVGGRNMKAFPIGLSLIASFISGISLLSIPTEVYVYGTSYLFISFGLIITGLVMSNVFLPVFHDLKLTSTYEYLERRFDKRIRLLGSVLFSISMIVYLPIVIYVPALAFNQVTGINVHIITPFVCIICIFYTCMGGLKAVVWADFIQAFVMFGSMLLIVIKGTSDVNGLSVVLERNRDSGRLEFPTLDWSPMARHTVWSLIIGGFVQWLQSLAISQNIIQLFLALPTLKLARRALWCFILGVSLIVGTCGYAGLLIYAWYYKCDPLTTKLAGTQDQLLPLLVMNVLGDYPGLPGLFVAGVFSAALSSLSTGLNSMAAVVLEDFIKPFRKTGFTPRITDILIKCIVIIIGVICVALAFIVEKTGSHVLQLTISLNSITNGPSLGIFTMGVLMPWVNAKGALIGGLAGCGFMSWITLTAQAAIATGRMKFDEKPVSIKECTYSFPQVENLFLLTPPETVLNEEDGNLFPELWALYRISYLWYTVIGTLVTLSIGLIVSIISSEDVDKLDPMLLAPFIRKFLRSSNKDLRQTQVAKTNLKVEEQVDTEDDKILAVSSI